jgi:hypothetical protein
VPEYHLGKFPCPLFTEGEVRIPKRYSPDSISADEVTDFLDYAFRASNTILGIHEIRAVVAGIRTTPTPQHWEGGSPAGDNLVPVFLCVELIPDREGKTIQISNEPGGDNTLRYLALAERRRYVLDLLSDDEVGSRRIVFRDGGGEGPKVTYLTAESVSCRLPDFALESAVDDGGGDQI